MKLYEIEGWLYNRKIKRKYGYITCPDKIDIEYIYYDNGWMEGNSAGETNIEFNWDWMMWDDWEVYTEKEGL